MHDDVDKKCQWLNIDRQFHSSVRDPVDDSPSHWVCIWRRRQICLRVLWHTRRQRHLIQPCSSLVTGPYWDRIPPLLGKEKLTEGTSIGKMLCETSHSAADNCFQATCTIKPCSHPDELEHKGALEQPSLDGIQCSFVGRRADILLLGTMKYRQLQSDAGVHFKTCNCSTPVCIKSGLKQKYFFVTLVGHWMTSQPWKVTWGWKTNTRHKITCQQPSGSQFGTWHSQKQTQPNQNSQQEEQ